MQRGVLFMIASALAFSAMSMLVKVAGERLPSQEIVVARALVSLALSWSLLRRAGVSPWGRDRKWLWIRGLLGFGGLSCLYGAVTHLPLAETTMLQHLHPPLAALFAGLFLGERVPRRIFLATAASLVGVALIAKPGFLFGESAAGLDSLWVGIALLGAIFTAAAYVVVRKLSLGGEDPLVIVFYFPMVTLPVALPTMGTDFVWPVGAEWILLLGIGLATQVGQVTLTRGLAILPAAHGTALSYLQIVFAVGWGFLVFGQTPDALAFLGGALVVGSALWLARAPTHRTRP